MYRLAYEMNYQCDTCPKVSDGQCMRKFTFEEEPYKAWLCSKCVRDFWKEATRPQRRDAPGEWMATDEWYQLKNEQEKEFTVTLQNMIRNFQRNR